MGEPSARGLAEHAIKYVSSPDFINNYQTAAGVLLADDEFEHEPTHITIVGHKNDTSAIRLDEAARAFPASNKRIDWWDKREGALPNADVQYPEMDRAAAFACGNRLCSLPAFTPEDLAAAVSDIAKATGDGVGR